MKRKSILKPFWKAVLSFALINTLVCTAFAQNTVTISRPGNIGYYEFDNSNWVHKHNITQTYNTNGWLLTSLNTTPITNQNLSKTEYILDNADRVNTITGSNWQNNTWVTASISNYIRTYNAANKVTELIWQLTKNGVLTNERKTNYVYDAAGNLVEETNYLWRNNVWQENDKSIYSYVNNTRTERLMHGFNKTSATWTPIRKYIYAGWHIPNQQHTSMLDQELNSTGTWINKSRSTITVGNNGSYEELMEYYVNNSWTLGNRKNMTYDSQGNVTDFLFEEFVNSTWRMVWIDKQIFTYSPQNDMLEMIYQGQDSTYGPLKNQYKEVYSNFQYFTRALGTSENQKTELALNVYPNPATDKIQIQLAESKPQALTATVKDITGKTWLTKTFKAAESKQLNIEALPKGIYLLQMQTEKGSTVKRIIKQ